MFTIVVNTSNNLCLPPRILHHQHLGNLAGGERQRGGKEDRERERKEINCNLL